MWSSTYSRRMCCVLIATEEHDAAVTATRSRLGMLIRTNIAATLLLAAGARPASPQSAAPLLRYRDSVPRTLVSFEMIPVPGGTVTLDTPAGPRAVSVGPF